MAARAGIPCKFVWVVSNTDGATGESVRIHAHGVINGELLPLLEQIWLPFGSVNAKSMYERSHTYAALARYMIKQSCAAPGEKRYSASRNLAKPIEIKREIPAFRENIVLSAPPASEMIANPDVFLCYIRATYFSQDLKYDYVGYIQRRLNHSFKHPPTLFGAAKNSPADRGWTQIHGHACRLGK